MSERPGAPASLTPSREVELTRVTGAGLTRARDAVAAEEPLDIRLHGRSFAVIMRTPGEDRALAAGFLLSERVIRTAGDIGAVEHCRHPDQAKSHHIVDVFLRGEAALRVPGLLEGRRQVVANSSCGVCGRATIDDLRAGIPPLHAAWSMDIAVIRTLPEQLRARQSTFDETGGLHGAAVFAIDGAMLGSAEDVGRHNAVDKILGGFLLRDEDPAGPAPIAGAVLLVSGRVSFEIVQKAWLGGIAVVAAISAPTSLAIELAHEAGITLLGFVRDHSLNIYTHERRIRAR